MTEQTKARVNVKDLPISTKWAIEISNFIRNKPLSEAKKQLELVLQYKLAIPLRRFTFDIGHRKGNMGPGFYPQKSTKYILSLLNSAESNAEYKGMDLDRLRIVNATVHKGVIVKRFIPRAMGRATPKNNVLTHVELVAQEI